MQLLYLQVCGIFDYRKPSSTCQTIPTPLPLNIFTRVQIQQIPNGADFKFIVKYNGVNQFVGEPKNLQKLEDEENDQNVKVYERDPNMRAANVETKNYKFFSGMESPVSMLVYQNQ